jgi:Xaa-Pro dipeptidase
VDELPVIAAGFREPLQAGMTIALEPKFFFGTTAAAGVENTFLVRASGPAECLIPDGHAIRVV